LPKTLHSIIYLKKYSDVKTIKYQRQVGKYTKMARS
jgi:hypothetical protein